MLNKSEVENLIKSDQLNYRAMASVVGRNNTKKISAILEILKIDVQSVADSNDILEICKLLLENQTTALTEIKL